MINDEYGTDQKRALYERPPRGFKILALVCALGVLLMGTCYAGKAPDAAGKGEVGAIILGVILLAAAAYFWSKRNKRIT